MATPTPARESVSARSLKLMKGPLSYIHAFFRASKEGLWEETKRDGWIPLVVAENKLNNVAVLDKLEAVTDMPSTVMNYANMKGIPELTTALAALMHHTFLPDVELDPQCLVVASGCSSLIDNLFYCLADEGEGVLIPAPFYAAFINDLTAKCSLQPLPFYLDEGPSAPSMEAQLDAAAAEAEARGITVRGLLITNPNNPLGTVYPREVVEGMLRWCLAHKVHCVSDEIYALSVYRPDQGPAFHSALSVAGALVAAGAAPQADVDNYIHMLWGMSKDFCGSGLRVGVLYSRNARLQAALNSVVIFGCVSNHTQYALARVLADLPWVDAFLAQNQAALARSYGVLTEGLTAAGIPFLPAVAGMFVWIDLRAWLAAPGGWEAEAALWSQVCDDCHVILTPGQSCYAAKPGFFRLCFAWVPPAALDDALERLSGFLKAREQQLKQQEAGAAAN